jgi:hypothetical protein
LLAFLGAASALVFKSTGFVILGTLCLVYLIGIFRFLRFPSLKILTTILAIILLSTLASQHRLISDFFRNETPTLVSVRGLHSELNLETSFGSFVYFDIKDYLMIPYNNVWKDVGGRQYFWNFFVKSTLFGEFQIWNSPLGKFLASFMNALNLILFLLMLHGILKMKIQDLPSLLFFIALMSSIMFTRAYYSVSCLQNFRYVVPVVLPMLLFAFNGAYCLQNSRLRIGAYLSFLLLSVLSFLFIVGQAA